MSDAMLTAGAPARAGTGDRPGGPERADRADSSHVLLRDQAALGGPGMGHRPGRWPAWFRAMTQVPARWRAQAGGRPGPAEQDPALDGLLPSSRWRRFGWMFAAIWLVYLAQPACTASDPARPGPPLPGPGRPDRVRGRVRRDVCRRPSLRLGRTGLCPGGSAWGRTGRRGHARRVRLLPIGGSRPAACSSTWPSWPCSCCPPAWAGPWWPRASWRPRIVPWQVHGWTADGTLAFQIFVSALAAWGVGQVIQRNAQLRGGPERDHPAGPGRPAQSVRPRPARHPRPLAHRGGGQGGTGRAAGQPRSAAGRDRDRGRGTDRPAGAGRRPGRRGRVPGDHPGRGTGQRPDRAGRGRHRGGPARSGP